MKRYQPDHPFRLRNWILLFCLGIFFITGCGTIQHQPFAEFTTSLQELQKGADKALEYNDISNRNRFIEETAEVSTTQDGEEAVSNLLIEGVEGNPFAWKMDEVPLFMVSPRFRSGVYTLNSTLVAYSELLASLAAPELVSQEKFDDMARDLNGSLSAAAATLELEGMDEGVGIFSVAASQAAHAYIEHRRQGKLREVLEENQENISEISSKLQAAIRIAARNLRQTYEEQSIKLARHLVPNSSVGLDARRKTVAALVDLNDAYLSRLKVLETLDSTYRSLPKAHAELIEAVDKPGFNFAAVKGLYEKGKYMYDLYKEIKEGKE
jgi:hypothetical protein